MTAYYNEIDPFKAEVLREAVEAGAIAPGDVDERSIADVRPDELRGYRQCHFFAGGGFWSLALRQAGWLDDHEVWTGSCPCPSFSAAGKGEGFADPRHLWPEWIRLIRERRPGTIFGEQVAAAIGHGWLDLISGDLEAEDYAVAAAVLGAHSVGAPHIRQRLYFVAESASGNEQRLREPREGVRPWKLSPRRHCANSLLDDPARARRDGQVEGAEGDSRNEAWLRGSGERCRDGGVGIAVGPGLERHAGDGRDGHKSGRERENEVGSVAEAGGTCGLADADGRDARAERQQRSGELGQQPQDGGAGGVDDAERNRLGARRDDDAEDERQFAGAAIDHFRASPLNGLWRDADWIGCRDGKWRPVKPGTFPLAHGYPGRVGLLRLAGDAICVPAAQAFIEAYLTTDH